MNNLTEARLYEIITEIKRITKQNSKIEGLDKILTTANPLNVVRHMYIGICRTYRIQPLNRLLSEKLIAELAENERLAEIYSI